MMTGAPKRYFIDLEFIEDGCTIDPISIGIVCEDGRELYAVNQDAQLHRASTWVREHVLPLLPAYGHPAWMSRLEIRDAIRSFVTDILPEKPEIWGYYSDYDWVAVCQFFGTMMALPAHFPMFCLDLKQFAVMLGNPALPAQKSGEHNALADARWNREVYAFLETYRARAAGRP